MQNRQKSEYLRCYKATYDFYKHHGHIPTIQRLENETSFALEAFLRLEQVDVQYVPPGIDRQSPSERAIRHVKNTRIAMCSTYDPTFPAEKLFEDALLQAEIVINCPAFDPGTRKCPSTRGRACPASPTTICDESERSVSMSGRGAFQCQKLPPYRYIQHRPVSAQANYCT
jgi:hypothetical protein